MRVGYMDVFFGDGNTKQGLHDMAKECFQSKEDEKLHAVL